MQMPQQGLMQPQQGQPSPMAQAPPQPVQAQQPVQGGQAPVQPQQGQPQQGPPGKRNYDTNPPNEEDQAQLDKFQINIIKMIHSEGMTEKLVNMIKDPNLKKHPVDKISDVALMMMMKMDDQAKKDGKPLDDLVKIQGGAELVSELISVLEAKKAIPKTNDDEKALILSHATQKYSNDLVRRGEISQDELKHYANQGMSAANQSGSINMDKIQGKRNLAQDTEDLKAGSRAEEVAPNTSQPTMTQRLVDGTAGKPQGGLLNG